MTAVEWLFEKIWQSPKDKLNWYALRAKAIEMEKQQMPQGILSIGEKPKITFLEISDEEIGLAKWKEWEKYNKEPYQYENRRGLFFDGFNQAIQWYREQLKQPKQ